MKDIYAVRLSDSHRMVCVSAIDPIFGETTLAQLTYETADLDACEYARLSGFSMGWPGYSPTWPLDGDSTYKEPTLQFGHPMLDDADDLKWSKFGTGFIYFLRCGKRIKIGFSNNVQNRVTGLMTAAPDPVEFLCARSGSLSDERRLHQIYAEYRSNGEWYVNKGRLLNDIRGLHRVDDFCIHLSDVRHPTRYSTIRPETANGLAIAAASEDFQ